MFFKIYFTLGSEGTAVITETKAALWTDGRYFLQAQNELDENWTLMKMGLSETLSIEDWLIKVLPQNSTVGVNASLYNVKQWEEKSSALSKKGHKLVNLSPDIVDSVWENKPRIPKNPLIILDRSFTGHTVNEKLQVVWNQMKARNTDWLLVTSLDDIAWLLNMRGNDIEFNPVFFSYIVLSLEKCHLFICNELISSDVKSHLNDVSIAYHDYNEVFEFIKHNCQDAKVWISQDASYAVKSCVDKLYVISTLYNPVSFLKAVKNETEIKGMKKANLLDGVALCQYFQWLESEVPKGGVTECSAAAKSLELRKKQDHFISLSFGTISSSGPSGSIIHYSPSLEDDKPVQASEIYLCDSGGQYKCGTTDTTRTMHFGEPTQHEKECFTRVLKGHIALSKVVFPKGTKGYMLDTLARMFLWKDGLDYRHGTGHGVGSFLNVHEGPTGIYIGNSERVTSVAKTCEVLPGMIITDEPGYYEDGKFGIRIENAVLCVVANTKFNFQNTQFLTFAPICHVPIQQKMIDISMLTKDEVTWLNNYHAKCLSLVGDEMKKQCLDNSTMQWLKEQTKPIVQ